MTDYYYQARYDDPSEEDDLSGEDRRRRPRPDPAYEFPADRDFFARRRDLLDLVPARDNRPAGEAPDDSDAGFRGDAADPRLPAVYDPDASAYHDDGYVARDGPAYDAAGYGETEAADQYDPPDYDDEPDSGQSGDRWDEPDVDAGSEPYVPPPMAPDRVSVADAGRQAARRIRFDPTQERGAGHYSAAHRHSRLVRTLKFALPGIALAGILAFLAFIQFAPAPDDAIITLSGINVESESVTMQTPHISGFDGTKRAYEVRAAHAIQDLSNPKIVTMEDINAHLRMDDGETAHLRATTGTYNDDTKKMVLSKGISLETTNGYKATLEDAQVDVGTSQMASSNPVTIVTEQATVKANAMELRDSGKYIMFKNGVTVFFTPPPEKAADDQQTDAPAPAAETPADPAATTGGST
ncbi:MAG: LPS export ABC transporter periplasmic protein LptC [Bauldia sp.]|uniref:LPS export ABC transporter periplasmic protein LptC n=1 Tax=Bauldia sp. TaxID=2575872 RepID=UPI001DED9AFE|nr:LPS export ABC transporter periplasmic protein LptC [Bauldia sp.]MCB1496453.1 LPS export ABC transporter periplasmic protein LptC [Bauldia sp.]